MSMTIRLIILVRKINEDHPDHIPMLKPEFLQTLRPPLPSPLLPRRDPQVLLLLLLLLLLRSDIHFAPEG